MALLYWNLFQEFLTFFWQIFSLYKNLKHISVMKKKKIIIIIFRAICTSETVTKEIFFTRAEITWRSNFGDFIQRSENSLYQNSLYCKTRKIEFFAHPSENIKAILRFKALVQLSALAFKKKFVAPGMCIVYLFFPIGFFFLFRLNVFRTWEAGAKCAWVNCRVTM